MLLTGERNLRELRDSLAKDKRIDCKSPYLTPYHVSELVAAQLKMLPDIDRSTENRTGHSELPPICEYHIHVKTGVVLPVLVNEMITNAKRF